MVAQIEKLKREGLTIDDEEFAEEMLQHVGMYRLEEYFHYFRVTGEMRFYNGVTFSRVVSIYIFDRRLRGLILDGVERVEISLRANLCKMIEAVCRTKFWYQEDIFSSVDFWEIFVSRHKESWERTPKYEKFMENSIDEAIPISLLVEISSFGALYDLLLGLKRTLIKNISRELGINSDTKLCNWLKGIRSLRNRCAHHERIWNRILIFPMSFPKGEDELFGDRRSIGTYLKILNLLVMNIAPRSTWKRRVCSLIQEFNINPEKMELEDFCN